MIRNKLAELLAERNLKISRVANDLPNLSRNTITSVAKNSTKMIQIETVDSLCQYLNVSPDDFFEFVPFNIKINSLIDKDLTNSGNFYSDVNNDVLCLGDLSFSIYLNKSSSNINVNSKTFDLSITPTNKYIFLPFFTIKNPFDKREIIDKNIFSTHFNVLLGHYDEKETYYNQIDDFKKTWFKELSAGFRSSIEEEIKTQIINLILKKIAKEKENDININDMNIDFSFTFNNANEFKVFDNSKTKDDLGFMPF